MNKEQKQTWKKLSKTELVLGDDINGYLDQFPETAQELIADLGDHLDSEFTVLYAKTYKDPNTLELYSIVEIRKTKKK